MSMQGLSGSGQQLGGCRGEVEAGFKQYEQLCLGPAWLVWHEGWGVLSSNTMWCCWLGAWKARYQSIWPVSRSRAAAAGMLRGSKGQKAM